MIRKFTRRGKLENKLMETLSPSEIKLEELMDIIYDFEHDNIQTIKKLRKDRHITIRRINGGLHQTINAHGPITKLLIGSASKRIHGNLLDNKSKQEPIPIKGFVLGCILTLTIIGFLLLLIT
jgi:hypothetical protein